MRSDETPPGGLPEGELYLNPARPILTEEYIARDLITRQIGALVKTELHDRHGDTQKGTWTSRSENSPACFAAARQAKDTRSPSYE